MSGWDDLRAARWLITRPLTTWPGTVTPAHERRRSPFSAGWGATVMLLSRELDHLGAERAVLELAITEDEIRLDGLVRASARPTHPGVVISLDSRHGPLRYAVDTYIDWQANIRAIALALEALRAVDRYGVTRSGEQYRGWRAIEAGTSSLVERGREMIRQHGGVAAALHATHPDRGGTREDLEAVLAARGEA